MVLLENLTPPLHYDQWWSAVVWFLIFAVFISFIPFRRKSRRRVASMYVAFIVASALEMFGIPLSMYFIAWAFGVNLPSGLLWGHTLEQHVGYLGMYIGFILNLIGGILIFLGWKAVYQNYWIRDAGEGKLVTDGIYAYTRHPQYVGFILVTFGLLVHWATIPLLIMWPMLVLQYYRLARSEEKEMEEEFGEGYRSYRRRVPMFIGFPKRMREEAGKRTATHTSAFPSTGPPSERI